MFVFQFVYILTGVGLGFGRMCNQQARGCASNVLDWRLVNSKEHKTQQHYISPMICVFVRLKIMIVAYYNIIRDGYYFSFRLSEIDEMILHNQDGISAV